MSLILADESAEAIALIEGAVGVTFSHLGQLGPDEEYLSDIAMIDHGRLYLEDESPMLPVLFLPEKDESLRLLLDGHELEVAAEGYWLETSDTRPRRLRVLDRERETLAETDDEGHWRASDATLGHVSHIQLTIASLAYGDVPFAAPAPGGPRSRTSALAERQSAAPGAHARLRQSSASVRALF